MSYVAGIRFDPNYVLGNHNIFGYDDSFQIRKFLHKMNSPLLKMKVDVPQIIYDACHQETNIEGIDYKLSINPKFILATLQKESSGITQVLSQEREDWCMGFGVPDNSTKNIKYKGFKNQIFAAAARQEYYKIKYSHLINKPFRVDALLSGTRYVNCVNQATLNCYLYCPWVGDRVYRGQSLYGNKLLYTLWIAWWGDPR